MIFNHVNFSIVPYLLQKISKQIGLTKHYGI